MKIKELSKKICVGITVVAVLFYYSGFGANTRISANANVRQVSKQKEYIVRAKSKTSLSKVKRNHLESEEINDNNQDLLEENKMVSVQLSDSEREILSKDNSIEYVEEDVIVEGSFEKSNLGAIRGKVHEKKERVNKKNNSSHEWNVRMVNADKIKASGKNRIKIAVLDSGVDCGNDISLAYSISLVPGEEEMTKLFMDGSGHGSSVASLIAAEDNGEGITGINPNAEIYSIRVLDDANQSPLSRVIEAIYIAIDEEVNIINMSFGLDTYSEALEEAIQAAADAGILIVAAAGNTGRKGVQYPAAYDEVLAVGSVDKRGEVADYSARGEEVELVAPGELVRTTGFLGTEMVTTGTSLAAPQVAAVASLIWEKDPSVSADFVRELLKESSNLYGDSHSYGSGLVDAEYALKHYDEFKDKYNNNEKERQSTQIIQKNEGKIETFEDTGCVEGCWQVAKHAEMVDSSYFNVREGARFPDTPNYGDYENRVFARMSLNPWWHGYYKKTNYIKAVIYATRMGDAIKDYGKTNQDKAISPDYNHASNMENDINYMDNNNVWTTELKRMKSRSENASTSKAQTQKDTVGFRRAFLWGMAIHCATDTYAHSAYYQGEILTHTTTVNGVKKADSTEVCKARYEDAQKIAKQIMARYKNNESLRVSDLVLSKAPTSYKLCDLYKYVREASDANVASTVYSYSYSVSSK